MVGRTVRTVKTQRADFPSWRSAADPTLEKDLRLALSFGRLGAFGILAWHSIR